VEDAGFMPSGNAASDGGNVRGDMLRGRIWWRMLCLCPSVNAASDGGNVRGDMLRGRIW